MKPFDIKNKRCGLSLMEVIVAIAIMGGALAVIGNFVFIGSRSARDTRWVSEAQILCDAKMAEVSSGVLPLDSTSGVTIEDNPNWVYAVEVQSSELVGLLKVTVAVSPSPSLQSRLPPVVLSRLLPDPDYEPEESIIQ